jgi:hypothetical protein
MFREAFTAGVPPHALPRRVRADTVDRVVFLLHGLRSSRDEWVRELAPMLRQRLPHAEVVESSYGWTTLLGFTLPSVRRRELRWLQDQYTEYLARHPAAVFDVAAHSYGAYLLGQSLQRVPSMRFGRVLLLGSVLPAEYPWRERHDWGQADIVRTDRAAEDMVVAVFCSALHGIGMTDVGTSGWSGFEEHGEVETDVVWHSGGHSAALEPANLESLAEFISTGRVTRAPSAIDRPPRSVTIMSQLAPWLARLLVVGLAAILVHWLRRSQAPASRRIGVAMATMVVLAIVLDVL